ncbi:hypothetical protein ACIA59_28505 [Micromonospora haikouensis]|uniref:hypothetical protein n=1 Tax=Micromonospora haikouensis TaxID=686309 RepID=UPI0037BB878F
MSGMEPQDVRRLGRIFLLSLPLLVFAVDFLLALLSRLLLSMSVPEVLGEVATGPAGLAASIALVKLPITVAYTLAVSRPGWTALVTRGELPPPPIRKGRRLSVARMRDHGMEAVAWLTATLIVLHHVVDPGEAQVWRLALIAAVVPSLLWFSTAGLVWLTRHWWRHRPSYRPRHTAASSTFD